MTTMRSLLREISDRFWKKLGDWENFSEFESGTASWVSANIDILVPAQWRASEHKVAACGDALAGRPLRSVTGGGFAQAKVDSDCDEGFCSSTQKMLSPSKPMETTVC